MGEKLVIGPINKGLRNDRTAFVIDNDSFPTLINAYQWRGRVKRKRGTQLLTRLQRFFNSTNPSYGSISSFNLVGGAGNLISGFNLQTNAGIIPGSVTITDNTTSTTYTDPAKNGTLSGGAGGTINYASGAITITGATTDSISASFLYNPDLPVLGIEDLILTSTQFPATLAFDQTYSYNVVTASPYPSYDVSFYKNPPSGAYTDGTTPYVQKTNATPVTWNGQDYQQFWSTNYEGAFWVTNGIQVPFSSSNIGMQFQKPSSATWVRATAITFTITASPLVVGDFVFANEWTAVTPANAQFLNFQTGYVSAVVGTSITVIFPNANIPNDTYSGGILQYLTTRSNTAKDCIRWYDGDPTNGSATSPVLSPGNGWVNFMPPLSKGAFSIGGLPPAQYYLITARMMIPFKDRLLFLGPVVGNSGGGLFYLQDTIVYSQNGTPYYTASFQGDPTLATTIFNPILVPNNFTASAAAWYSDVTGFGGFISAGISQPIVTVSTNEDVLIVGFSFLKARVVFSGNDIVPFNFFIINAELGDASTFSVINMDKGVISRGTRGYTITSQVESQRIDLEIPDQVFEIDLTNNGNERFCAVRNFISEWVYFTYPSNNREKNTIYRYPDQTLIYNYRDNSWAIFNESYTTYGSFRKQTGFTWQTVGFIFPSWTVWNEPWDAGESTLEQQDVLAGNQQGFLIIRDIGTGEGASLYIQNIVQSTNTVTSPDHNLSDDDYIMISGCLGTIGPIVNGQIYSIFNATQNTFQLNPQPLTSGTYLGGGVITRMIYPYIQTKQFPTAWQMARKTRLGPQQYLFTTTPNAQVTLLIFLSQNAENSYNYIDYPFAQKIIPDPNSPNNAIIYSAVLFTCPESTNLGLTPANINLQTPTAVQQQQIWHRMNTSLIGDTVQIGITLSDAQMRAVDANGNPISQFAEIEFHSAILDINPSQLLV